MQLGSTIWIWDLQHHKQQLFQLKNLGKFQVEFFLNHNRAEIPGGLVVLGGDNVSPMVKIGLADLPYIGGALAPHLATALYNLFYDFEVLTTCFHETQKQ